MWKIQTALLMIIGIAVFGNMAGKAERRGEQIKKRERRAAFTVTPVALTPNGTSDCVDINNAGEVIGQTSQPVPGGERDRWNQRVPASKDSVFVWRAGRIVQQRN